MNRNFLLKQICYYSRPSENMVDLCGNTRVVQHTFPCNPDSKTSHDTAKNWSKRWRWDVEVTAEPKTKDNTPFSITLVDLDVRSEGGRAYKVVDDNGLCFDLREDELLEMIKLHGIKPGGETDAKFVWGVSGSQVKLVCVGGALHQDMLSGLNDREQLNKKLAAGLIPKFHQLKQGYVYKDTNDEYLLFIRYYRRDKVKGAVFVNVPKNCTFPADMPLENKIAILQRHHEKTTHGPRFAIVLMRSIKVVDVIGEFDSDVVKYVHDNVIKHDTNWDHHDTRLWHCNYVNAEQNVFKQKYYTLYSHAVLNQIQYNSNTNMWTIFENSFCYDSSYRETAEGLLPKLNKEWAKHLEDYFNEYTWL